MAEERRRMIAQWEAGAMQTELAQRFGVSRQTIHTYIERWRDEGEGGLLERSRRPLTSPAKTSREVEELLLRLKDEHPDYGPNKLVTLLADEGVSLPASTARDVLRRNGRVEARRGRTRIWSPAVTPVIAVPGPGHTMSADYKGQARLGNGRYCYPLTIADPASRYVFAVQAATMNTGRGAQAVFERVFREWGLPDQILTDNGAPFCASRSIGGLSQLGRWWIQLGVTHARIQPGRPQQNGVHERMHKTLKEKTMKPTAHTMAAQQRSFDRFIAEFNHIRPHESLGQKRPAAFVSRYRRPFPERLPQVEYPSSFIVRCVRGGGFIKWQGELQFVSEVLVGERVGLVQISDDSYELYFGNCHLANWSSREGRWVEASR